MGKLLIIFFLISIIFGAKVDRTLSHKSYEVIKNVQKLVDEKMIDEAIVQLDKLYKSINNNRVKDYEKAFVIRMFAYLYISNNDYDNAIKYFKKSYDYNIFKSKEQISLLKNIAQIYMAKSDFKNSIHYYHLYLNKSDKKDSKAYIALSSAYSEIKKINQSIKYVKLAIKYDKEPKRSWYEMLLSLYYNQNNFIKSIEVQESIIKKYGIKKSYLLTLSSLYQYIKNNKKALELLESAYDMGYFTKESDYYNLAYMNLSARLPDKCVAIIEHGLNRGDIVRDKQALRLLANAYSMARDDTKALQMYIELARLSNDGNVYAQVAQSYLGLEQYKEAIYFFKKAISSKNIKNRGGVYLLLGISYYELKDFKNSKIYLKKALKYDSSAKSAKDWLSLFVVLKKL